MIYSLPKEMYPKPEVCLGRSRVKDKNDFEWELARITEGFMLTCLGPSYFLEDSFEVQVYGEIHRRLENFNCIFFKDTTFETYCQVRDLITEGYTDDAWISITDLFQERFNVSSSVLEHEILI